jgi:hypothetical protein
LACARESTGHGACVSSQKISEGVSWASVSAREKGIMGNEEKSEVKKQRVPAYDRKKYDGCEEIEETEE